MPLCLSGGAVPKRSAFVQNFGSTMSSIPDNIQRLAGSPSCTTNRVSPTKNLDLLRTDRVKSSAALHHPLEILLSTTANLDYLLSL